jgi:hypothetical protein
VSDGLRHSRIVDCALGAQPFDGGFNDVGFVPLTCEPIPDLSLGQLATTQHSETVHVRASFRLWALGLALWTLRFCTHLSGPRLQALDS